MSKEHLDVTSALASVRWGRLPGAGAAPVGCVRDGGTVRIETVSHEGILEDQGRDPVAFFGRFGVPVRDVLPDAIEIAASNLPHEQGRDGPHVVTGPVAVEGARPGDLLRVDVLALERRCDYGVVSNRHGRGVLAGELPRPGDDGEAVAVVSTFARVTGPRRAELTDASGCIAFDLGEFLGLIGVAPATDDELVSTPPGPYGGNLDIRHLGVGAVLYLPVLADGGLVYAGDPHFAQGNGEVALTALEAPLAATLRLSVLTGSRARALAATIAHPFGETRTHLVAVGIGDTLDAAMRMATVHAISIVRDRTGIGEALALAYLSAAADFEVSQAVNGVRGVHCLIKKDDLAAVAE